MRTVRHRLRRASSLVALAVMLAIAGCSTESGTDLLVTLQAQQTVVVLVDNCPAPDELSVSSDTGVVWAIERTTEPAPQSTLDITVGEAPVGWLETLALAAPLDDSATHTIVVDGDSISFTLDDLAQDQVFDGTDSAPRGPTSGEPVTCDEAGDGEIEGFGDFALTALILLVVGLGVFGLVAWGVVKLLQLLVDRR